MKSFKKRTDSRFRYLIGERVECLDKNGQPHVGILDFAGINELLHGQFQVTLGRCPIWPVDPATIKKFTP